MKTQIWRSFCRRALLPGIVVLQLATGCINPFAPELGEFSEDLWDPQTTAGGLLRNFQTAYTLCDSLKYSDLIADEFVFQFFDVERQRFDQWYRETELKATGGLMRSLDRLDLRWGAVSEQIDTFAVVDSTLEFAVNFSLSAGSIASITGFAYFQVRTGDDGRFRIVVWRDDF